MMQEKFKNHLLIILGWFFVVLGAIGALLPVLPTTPFLIIALALFSKSSPKFHQMLLNNKWFGAPLRQWEEEKTLSRSTKYKASILIIISFTTSIVILHDRGYLQLLLLIIAFILLFFIWRIKETPRPN